MFLKNTHTEAAITPHHSSHRIDTYDKGNDKNDKGVTYYKIDKHDTNAMKKEALSLLQLRVYLNRHGLMNWYSQVWNRGVFVLLLL